MAYTPTTWTTGDTITASALNKIEQGIAEGGGGALIVTTSLQGGIETMDKTVQEIYDALLNGMPVYYKYTYGTPSDYTGRTYLAPIITVYNYNYTNIFRVVVSYSTYRGSVGNTDTTFGPAMMNFSANGLADYPKLLATVVPTNVSLG